MKLRILTLTLAGLLCAGAVYAQDQRYVQRRATLAYQWDLDGEAADDDQVVTAANGALTDSKNFTLTADPDVCRLLDITVTDADSSLTAGAITVVGLDCLGYTKTCSFTFAAGGSGVKTLTCADGTGAYFSDVTSVTTGALTGEGALDTVTVGYTSNSVNGWAMYGTLATAGPSGEHRVDPFASTEGPGYLRTSGNSTTVVSTTGTGFSGVAVGDLLLIEAAGNTYERKVTAKASDASITVNQAITLAPDAPWRYRKFFYSSNPADIVAVDVRGYESASFLWGILANANTGGTVVKLECAVIGPGWNQATWTEFPLTTSTIASGSTTVGSSGAVSMMGEHIDVKTTGYDYCRFGAKFGTGDDADAAAEQINLYVSLIGPAIR